MQQSALKEQSRQEMRSGLESVRENLKGGNLREATTVYNRAKSKSVKAPAEESEARDLRQLEQDVRRAQSSNLIAAQNGYFLSNVNGPQRPGPAGQPAPGSQVFAPAGQGRNIYLNYDVNVAGLQWDKLEKAQQVAVAKVAPLRVNLPTRGVRYSFTQVLQTELRKPMTIRLLAENTRVPSWTSRIGLSVLGFGVLWLIVAALRRKKRVPA
jgi:hypothetical protein